MSDAITCTKIVRKDLGTDQQGKPVCVHEKCGAPAAEYEIGGMLTRAKAVLCDRHKTMADRENFVSSRGYGKGKVAEKSKEDGYQQERLTGTGVGETLHGDD